MNNESQNRIGPGLNDHQRNRLLITCAYIDKLIRDIENTLSASSSRSPFPKYIADIGPAQRKVIEDYLARVRAQLLRILDGAQIDVPPAKISAVHSIKTALTFIDIAVEELRPKYMKGYGEIPESVKPELDGIATELETLIEHLSVYLASETGRDLQKRIEAAGSHIDISELTVLQQVIERYGLVEFRPAISAILDRLEDSSFEIAIFGRVSSGKSSLLNKVLETDILPVGVTPITAVPTRIAIGSATQFQVFFADRPSQTLPIERVKDFVTEEHNSSNQKHVSRLLITLPSQRLREGITFVDTPGLGSLATSGAAETLAYLPRCDFGILMVDAGSTLTKEDLAVLQLLSDTRITVGVLLSKADLVSTEERARLQSYIETKIKNELALTIQAFAVSTHEQYADLVDNWFQNQLPPLYENAQKLRAQSMVRKIAVLRVGVEASLKVFLSRTERQDKTSVENIRSTERELRAFTGRFAAVRRSAEKLIEQLEHSTSDAIHHAVQHCVQQEGSSTDTTDRDSCIRQYLAEFFRRQTVEIAQALQEFAKEITQCLWGISESLTLANPPMEEDFARVIRDLPHFELPGMSVPATQGIGRFLRGRLLVAWMERRVGRESGDDLSQAVNLHCRMLHNWLNGVMSDLLRGFDVYADTCRAHMQRMISGSELPAEHVAGLRGDLERLEQLRAVHPAAS